MTWRRGTVFVALVVTVLAGCGSPRPPQAFVGLLADASLRCVRSATLHPGRR